MRQFSLAICTSLLVALPAVAQKKGAVEIGGFGRYNKFASQYIVTEPKDNRIGGGARLGYFVADNWALELDGSFNPTDLTGNQANVPSTAGVISRPLDYYPFHLRAIYNQPLGDRLSWMLGAGPGYHKLDRGIDDAWFGVGAMTGLRIKATDWLHLRLEGTADVLPSAFDGKTNTYLGAQAGLSLLPGGSSCNHASDMIGIRPTSANLEPGQSQAFSADATWCGAPDAVVYRLSGPGTLDSLTGRYTATTEGNATVTAYSRKGKLMSSANVTVKKPAPVVPAAPVRPAPPPPPPPPPARPKYTFDLQMVHFRFDHADLTKGGQDTVKSVAQILKDHPEVNVDVVGHTDWVGTNEYNMKLSRARAETVRNLLVKEGVAADRIAVKWRGEEEPVADNKTAAGRAQNRRTEIKQNN